MEDLKQVCAKIMLHNKPVLGFIFGSETDYSD